MTVVEQLHAALLVKQASRALSRLFPAAKKVFGAGTVGNPSDLAMLRQPLSTQLNLRHNYNPAYVKTRKGPEAVSILESMVPDAHQGAGWGRKMYGKEIRDAYTQFKHGEGPRHFTSDPNGATSAPASSLWESLKRRGYPVRVRNGATYEDGLAKYDIDLEDMNTFYKDRRNT